MYKQSENTTKGASALDLLVSSDYLTFEEYKDREQRGWHSEDNRFSNQHQAT